MNDWPPPHMQPDPWWVEHFPLIVVGFFAFFFTLAILTSIKDWRDRRVIRRARKHQSKEYLERRRRRRS